MSKGKTLKDDGERMIPEFHKGTILYAEHVTRYTAAREIARGRVVLDIASGSGYGTKILAEEAKKVFGVDIDKESVGYAKKHYFSKNVEYLVGSGESIPLGDNSVDVVVSFETIEHVKDYEKFMQEIKRVMKHDGILVLSTPNEKEFTKGNHFHLHEFERSELESLVKKYFKNLKNYCQATWVSVMLAPEKYVREETTFEVTTHNYMSLPAERDLYFYMLCSNRDITEEVTPVNAFGGHYSARELTDIENLHQKNIQDYKVVLSNANAKNQEIQQALDEVSSQLETIQNRLATLQGSLVYKLYKIGEKSKNILDSKLRKH